MARVKRGTKRRARRKKYLRRTKGFFLTKSKLYQSAQEAANRADRYAYRDRRNRKRQYRALWIQRIGAAARLNGLSYSQLMHGLKAERRGDRSQDARRPRRARTPAALRARRAGQGGASPRRPPQSADATAQRCARRMANDPTAKTLAELGAADAAAVARLFDEVREQFDRETRGLAERSRNGRTLRDAWLGPQVRRAHAHHRELAQDRRRPT